MVRFKVEINGYFVDNTNNIPEIIERDYFDTLIFLGLPAYGHG